LDIGIVNPRVQVKKLIVLGEKAEGRARTNAMYGIVRAACRDRGAAKDAIPHDTASVRVSGLPREQDEDEAIRHSGRRSAGGSGLDRATVQNRIVGSPNAGQPPVL
jgi:hypothetical protein